MNTGDGDGSPLFDIEEMLTEDILGPTYIFNLQL